ncbi:MAG: flagellar hook-length control protein FliK, partial [Bdellovibrio sp.]|nr:flagellar hook-length control protein FliK [Bdellovibrio sp.]
MQQLANQAQPATNAGVTTQVAQAGIGAGKTVDTSSSLLAKSLENLKAMAAAGANSAQPAVAPTAAGIAAMGFGIGAATDESAESVEGLEKVAGFENIAQMQNAQMMEVIPMAQQNQQAAVEELTFDQQLGAEVGFEPEVEDNKELSKSALLQKMKAFEAEKGLTPKEANSFELKVLTLLQQERNELAHQKYGSGEGSLGSGGFSHKENQGDAMTDAMKDVNSQALGTPDASLHAGQTQPGFKAHMSSMVDRAGVPLSPQAMAEHREENIQHVMSSAKLLAIKGGGEMVVKMSPDGMGPIELKVMMQDGKVNIEMQTQDKSVKKLIEDSLTELKSGLAAQKIHVDHVKIDTVSATNTENSASASGQSFRPQQDSSDAQGRQQEFWKQFRENFGNQGRKSSYGDVGSVPARTQGAPNALQPVTSSTARNGARTGSTINRVA